MQYVNMEIPVRDEREHERCRIHDDHFFTFLKFWNDTIWDVIWSSK